MPKHSKRNKEKRQFSVWFLAGEKKSEPNLWSQNLLKILQELKANEDLNFYPTFRKNKLDVYRK